MVNIINAPSDQKISLFTGTDGILLGAETLRGLYPVETIKTVGRICAEVSLFILPIWMYFLLIYVCARACAHTYIVSDPSVRPLTHTFHP